MKLWIMKKISCPFNDIVCHKIDFTPTGLRRDHLPRWNLNKNWQAKKLKNRYFQVFKLNKKYI